MPITTVLVDAAGTLFDLDPALEVRLTRVFAPQVVASDEEARQAIVLANTTGTWPEDQTDPRARVAAWTTFVAGLLDDMPSYAQHRDRFVEVAGRFARDIVDPRSYVARAGALDFLRDVRLRGLHCVIVSNFDHLLLDILGHLGMTELVDGVTFSGEVGHYKPDRRVFDAALGVVGARAGEAVMIGDSVYSDVQGAEAVGISAILLDPDDRATGHDGPRIRSLSQALSLI